jgi:hypothetical protein
VILDQVILAHGFIGKACHVDFASRTNLVTMVRVDIEGQIGSASWCAAPERKIQDTMPAELQGLIPTFQWQEFVSQGNQCFAPMNQKVKVVMRVRQVIMAVFFLVAIAGPLVYLQSFQSSVHDGTYLDSLILPVMIPMSLIIAVTIGIQVWLTSVTTQALQSLKQVCATTSSANPNVSFIVKDEIQGYGKHRLRISYIEVSVSQVGAATIIGVTTPQEASMMLDLEQQQAVSRPL